MSARIINAINQSGYNTSAYEQYKSAVRDQERAILDFNNKKIEERYSKSILGKLLITDKFPKVFCRNIIQSQENILSLFEGINIAFKEKYPNGIISRGTIITEPQIELFDPSGDGVYYVIQLGHEVYEAIKR